MPASAAKKAQVAVRRTKLVQARLAGARFDDIYEELGYASRGAATKDFQRAMQQYVAEERMSLEEYRRAELLRLDDLTAHAVRVLHRVHYHVSASGRVAEDPTTGEPLIDAGPTLGAIDRLTRISDRRAKLLGLDAPQKIELQTIDAIDAQIRELTGQLEALQSEEAAEPGIV